jgi:flagellar biogenesis protein FliO
MKKIIFCLLLLFSPVFSQEETPRRSIEEYPNSFAEELKKADQMGDSRFFEEFVQMMIYLGAIVAFMLFFMWLLKRMMAVRIEQTNRSCSIKILESRALTPKSTLYVVEISGKVYAIADSANGITRLGEIPETESVKNQKPSFREYMKPAE